MKTNTTSKNTCRFSNDGKELLINTPKLYRPWCNYLSGENYGLKFSQTGGGFSVYPILEGRRITRHGDNDQSGRYVYFRDNETADVWTLNWQPVQKDLDRYECRHGLGYSEIVSEYGGIIHSLRVSVLPDAPGEMWSIHIHNTGRRARNLSFFPFVDWYLGDGCALWDNPTWYTRAEFMPETNMIMASFFDPGREGNPYHVFIKAFFAISGWCCAKRAFCGMNGSLRHPELMDGRTFEYGLAHGEETIGCFKRDIILDADEKAVFQLLLGHAKDAPDAKKFSAEYADQERRDAAQTQIHEFWNRIVRTHEINTPDTDFNRWINVWVKYQEYQCFRWAGLGEPNAPLMGYRDVLQHTLGMSLFAPEMAKSRLIEALKHQYRNGRAVRQWSRKGRHDRRDYRDSPVWIIFSLCAYLKETHDFDLLDQTVPYLDDEGSDSVVAHAVNAVNALYADRGEHGLSRIGGGDWYDPLNKIGIKGRGESVWLSMALVAALRDMAALFTYMAKPEDAADFNARADEVAGKINEHGWDGAWYLYAYDDEGNKIGSQFSAEGNIFANTQIWAIIAGVADAERRTKCVASMDQHLKNKFGYSIVMPRFTLKSRHYGNAGILQSTSRAYAHVSAFKMVADCLRGNGDDAYAAFKAIVPDNPAHPPEKTLADPHIIPNGYTGVNADENEAFVLHSGSSGAFPWILKAAVEYMLGARADYSGLSICPCLPKTWPTASIRREFRGSVYNIQIENTGGAPGAKPEITLDGKKITGSIISPDREKREHNVAVII